MENAPFEIVALEPETLQRRHVRQLCRWLIAIMVAYGVFDVLMAILYEDLAIALCAGIFFAASTGIGVVHHRVGDGDATRASWQVAGMLLLLALAITLVYPTASNGTAVIPLGAVAVLLPYQESRRLLPVCLVAAAAALLITILGERLPSWTRAPESLVSFYRASSFPVGATIILLLLWQFHHRLSNALGRLRSVNRELREHGHALDREIEQRRTMEAQLVAAERRLRDIFDSLFGFVCLFDLEGRVIEVNRAPLAATGLAREEVLGRPVWEVEWWDRSDSIRTRIRDAVHRAAAGERLRFETTYRHRDEAAVRYVDAMFGPLHDEAGRITCVLGFGVDVTDGRRIQAEREALQARLLQAQKMESVGRLAGGVAHDFNNLLTVILVNCDLLRATPDSPSAAERLELVAEIRHAGQRARDLTRQLLAFGRKQVLEPRPLDLNRHLVDFERMLARLIGEDIRIDTVLHPGLGPIRADPVHLDQVLLNLAINARDAMKSGGRITFATDACEVTPGSAEAALGYPVGDCVRLRVVDTGSGMAPEVQSHVFEPFFTTKEAGRGTGLGLATAFGIVQQHGGHIGFETRPGHGTTFTLVFPRFHPEPAAARVADPEPTPPRGNGESILVVEDEPAIRRLIANLLHRSGYRVTEAESPGAALRRTAEGPGPDLLLTDVILPETSGKDLSERLRERFPALPVVFMSGYSEEVISHHGVLDPGVRLVQKPFAPATLLREIRAALDDERGPGTTGGA